MGQVDPITLAVVEASLVNIVREMRATMIRTSYAPILYETHDFSCALLDAKGELVGLSVDIPLHIFPLTFSVRATLEKFGEEIYPGDLFLANDPYQAGGTHLNDVAALYPFFIENQLALFIVVRAHWADVGGATPGSISGKNTELYQEGVCIPLVKAYDRGKPNQALLEVIFTNMRLRFEREGDFLAMVDTCRTAEMRLSELFARYGMEVIEKCLAILLDRADARMRRAISQLPDGEYHYEEYVENTGTAPDPLPAKARMKIEGDRMTLDFSGSAPQVAGPMNMGPSIVPIGIFIMMKTFFDSATPVNGGSFRPIQMIVPEGSFLNARFPAAVGGNFQAMFCAVQGNIWGLLAQMIPQQISAAPRSGVNHAYIGGWDPLRKREYLLYEYPAGGTQACLENDGSNTVWPFDLGDLPTIYPVERMEGRQPLLVESNELRVDSGGPGYRRGGLGFVRRVKVLSPTAVLSVTGEEAVLSRPGMSGGYGGALNSVTVIRDGMEIQPSDIPCKVAGFPLRQGDVVVMRQIGGAGYGDPLTREVERVRQDVVDGYVSAAGAQEQYGVVLVDGAVDLAKTGELRERIRKERVYIRVVSREMDEDEYDERSCRLCALSRPLAGRLEVKEGDVVEYVPERGAPLRAWVRLAPELKDEEGPLGPKGRTILKVAEGDKVWIRPLNRSVNR